MIGERPILWHILKIYSSYGINDFIICLGYKGYVIKEYFANYFLHTSGRHLRYGAQHHGGASPHRRALEGDAGRYGRRDHDGGASQSVLARLLDGDSFCMTYGDGVADINVQSLIDYHVAHGRLATVTAVRAPGRFGSLGLDGTRIHSFDEKPLGDRGWIKRWLSSCCRRALLDYIEDDQTIWERQPLRPPG